ncbi:MAG TPA: hypothetical protein VGG57_16830 [Stellaceae bacterium]|jgi:hypothetical protein
MGYLRRLLVACFVLLGAVAAFNGLMDATGLLGTPLIAGVNQVKSYGNDRFFKPLAVERRQPDTVFVGTSRVAVGLDPHDLPDAEAYNLGLLGSTVPEHIAFARYAIDNAPVTRLVFGLDFASFVDPARYSSAFRLAILRPYAFWRAIPDLLLSQSELLQSRITLTHSRRHDLPRFAADGMLIAANEHDDNSDPVLRAILKVEQYARFYHWAGPPDGPLGDFDTFLAGLPPRVKTYVYVTPAHAVLGEALKPAGLTAEYDDWLRRITTICAAHGVPLWDFNGYNRITTETLSSSAHDFVDGAHTTPEVGRLILGTLLQGATVPDFGVRLRPDMIDEYLGARRGAADAWRHDHPADWHRAAQAATRADAGEAGKGQRQ